MLPCYTLCHLATFQLHSQIPNNLDPDLCDLQKVTSCSKEPPAFSEARTLLLLACHKKMPITVFPNIPTPLHPCGFSCPNIPSQSHLADGISNFASCHHRCHVRGLILLRPAAARSIRQLSRNVDVVHSESFASAVTAHLHHQAYAWPQSHFTLAQYHFPPLTVTHCAVKMAYGLLFPQSHLSRNLAQNMDPCLLSTPMQPGGLPQFPCPFKDILRIAHESPWLPLLWCYRMLLCLKSVRMLH